MTSSSGTVRAAVGMGAITAVSRLVGFGRVLVVAAVLGTTYLGNAFQAANSVSNVVFELVAAGALSAILVPAFVRLLTEHGREAAEEVAGGVLARALVGLGLLALVGVLAAPLLARALTLGVDGQVRSDQQALIAFLLVFFLPQVVLYAAGTVATAVLHAEQRFFAVAAAPMANTAVMVLALFAFRAVAGGDPGLRLSVAERAILVIAGTGGVAGFTAVLVLACRRSGFRLRPRRRRGDPRVAAVLRQAGWGVLLHTSAGVLLAGSILAGAAVEGGVVAYQVGWVFFLAPYAIFAQPVHTAILPELVAEASDPQTFARSVRWALERIALPVLPISAAMVALAGPVMAVVSVGEAGTGDGAELLAAATASLAIGLLPYAAFLLLARAYFALGDARTPGRVAIAVAGIGATVMAVGAPLTAGAARIAVVGVAHTVAHLVGAAVLVVGLRRRTGAPIVGGAVAMMVAVSVLVGCVVWLVAAWADERWAGDLGSIAASGVGLVVGAILLVAGARIGGFRQRLTSRASLDVTTRAAS